MHTPRGAHPGAPVAGPLATWLVLALSCVSLTSAASLRHTEGRSRHSRRDPDFEGAGPADESGFGNTGLIDSYVQATRSSGLAPDPEAVAPPLNATAEALLPRHTLVVAQYDEDVAWLQHLPKNIDVVVYQSRWPNASHYVENYGNEASKYLAYIVQNYDSLPATMAFVQAGRQDWHDPLPKDVLLRTWPWQRAQELGGMAFLPTNAPCLIEDQEETPADAQPRQPPSSASDCNGVEEHVPKQMQAAREAWGAVFESELGPLPQRWLTHCCAQFEVTREAVRRRPLDFYETVLAWSLRHDQELLAGDYGAEMKRNHDPERRDAGHVMEPLWALLFQEKVF